MSLNEEQQEVVNTHRGAIALIAGPGSGKTHTLIARYNALLDSGARVNEILCVTFTREAAEEMKRRAGRGNFRTFHSYGYSIIAAEKGKPPLEPELRHRLLIKLTRRHGVDYKELAKFISHARHRSIFIQKDSSTRMEQAYYDYETERIAAGWIDFDSMICDSVQLLENPEVRERHQWKYIMADECQDTDDLQFRMLQLLSEKHGNVMCVGDPGQSIYMFRGAKPENLTDFTRWFPKGRFLFLGKNYRSTHKIVDFVRDAYPIRTPLRDKLLPARSERGEDVIFRLFGTETDEAESAVAQSSLDLLNSAILTRTNRQLAYFENLCIEHSIKYTLLGKSGFWKRREVMKVMEKAKSYPLLSAQAAIGIILPEIERHYQVEDATEEDNDALENLKSLREICKRFQTAPEMVAFANRAAHMKKTRGIVLSTVHQAKGREFKNVFLAGARDGVMPHLKGDYDEEKRIWFVAISRAIDRLQISFVGTPSPFFKSYLTPEVLAKLQENRYNVERIQKQFQLLESK